MTQVRLGVVILPEYPGPTGTARIWRRVEDWGVDHAWTFDHLAWRSLRDRPWFDAMTTLAAAAGATERITLGTLVSSPNYRHPVVTAKEVMTLDHLSDGRFVFGIGAGTTADDATVLGTPVLDPAERGARFEEFVTLTDLLLRQPVTSFHGSYYDAVDARTVPGCIQRPRVPFVIAATGPRGLRLAARYADIWTTNADPRRTGELSEEELVAILRRQFDRLTRACHDIGRDPAELRTLVNLSRMVPDPYSSVARFTDAVGWCAELGFTDVVVNHPRSDGIFAGDLDTFERAVTAVTGAPDRPETPGLAGGHRDGR